MHWLLPDSILDKIQQISSRIFVSSVTRIRSDMNIRYIISDREIDLILTSLTASRQRPRQQAQRQEHRGGDTSGDIHVHHRGLRLHLYVRVHLQGAVQSLHRGHLRALHLLGLWRAVSTVLRAIQNTIFYSPRRPR